MKVSIITTSFNSEKTILETIESVNNQTYSNIEHIFIDGLSTDNTLDIINENSKTNHKEQKLHKLSRKIIKNIQCKMFP